MNSVFSFRVRSSFACVVGLASVSLMLPGCRDGVPIAAERSRVLSPDRKSVAVLEGVDNGLGFGQGMYYDEIHVGPANLFIAHHGDEDPSVVFYAAQESSTDEPPTLEWLDGHHLVVTYVASRKPQKLLLQANGIQIEYRERSNEP